MLLQILECSIDQSLVSVCHLTAPPPQQTNGLAKVNFSTFILRPRGARSQARGRPLGLRSGGQNMSRRAAVSSFPLCPPRLATFRVVGAHQRPPIVQNAARGQRAVSRGFREGGAGFGGLKWGGTAPRWGNAHAGQSRRDYRLIRDVSSSSPESQSHVESLLQVPPKAAKCPLGVLARVLHAASSKGLHNSAPPHSCRRCCKDGRCTRQGSYRRLRSSSCEQTRSFARWASPSYAG